MKKIDFRKGSATLIFGYMIMLICLFVALVLIEQYSRYDNALTTQMATDSIADGTAVYASTLTGYDDDDLYNESLVRANDIAELIQAEETNDLFTDENIDYLNNLEIDRTEFDDDTVAVAFTTNNIEIARLESFDSSINDGTPGQNWYNITRHATTLFTRMSNSSFTNSFHGLDDNFPLILQGDPQWSTMPYYYNGWSTYNTIGQSACGPTCFAMVVQSLTDNDDFWPPDSCDLSTSLGCHPTGGTDGSTFFMNASSQYGLSCNYYSSLSEDEMKTLLDDGNMFICSMKGSDGTQTWSRSDAGHFITVYGYDDSGFKVNDPASQQRSLQYWSYQSIAVDIKRGIWAFKAL